MSRSELADDIKLEFQFVEARGCVIENDIHAVGFFELAANAVQIDVRAITTEFALARDEVRELLASGGEFLRGDMAVVIGIERKYLFCFANGKGQHCGEFIGLQSNSGDAQADIVSAGRLHKASCGKHERQAQEGDQVFSRAQASES